MNYYRENGSLFSRRKKHCSDREMQNYIMYHVLLFITEEVTD